MSRIVVVGAGISGLAAARALAGLGEVTVLEASARCGGKIAPLDLDGVRLDAGAESLLARRPEATELAAAVGLAADVVHPTAAQPAVLVDGRSVALPPTSMGVPAELGALGDVLSDAGWQRARREPSLPAPPLGGDVAIGELVDARFGPEVTDRVLEPLLGGVYAGHARRLSFEATSPALYERARTGGSLSGHAAALHRPPGGGPVFAGLVGGLGRLVDALLSELADLGVQVRTRSVVRDLDRVGSGFVLTCGPEGRTRRVRADAVVLAAPATPTGRLLHRLTPLSRQWASIPYASTAVVTMAVRGGQRAGSGLLVPPPESRTIKAVTHSSAKWTWVADLASARWGADVDVVRVSVGRLGEEASLQLDDAALLHRTFAEAGALPGWAETELVAGAVSRWGGGLPQYGVGHCTMVARLRDDLDRTPGLAVCGAALDGIGIAACVGSAALAATKIIGDLSGADERPGMMATGFGAGEGGRT